ncbi:hypothetical protein SNE40_017393 [Patella caerulea]|uniref:Ig-like domain-containing protein n=1 Tax=Patella caerulea TaxID=87958 RepID=A0AAN8JAC8_PATCE
MFVVSVQGVAETKISCGESGGVVGQPQVLSCNISGSIVNNIYWYRYNDTYNQNIVQCSKSSAKNVSTCVAPPNLRSKYSVSIEDQPPRKPSFTIISVSAEDLEVSWLCVDSITFPDRASILDSSSTCSLKQGLYNCLSLHTKPD